MNATSVSLKTPIIVVAMATNKCFVYIAGNCSTRDRKTSVGTKKKRRTKERKENIIIISVLTPDLLQTP